MNFCPYCGHLEGKKAATNNHGKDKETLELMYQKKQFDEIFENAASGNIIAKYYYIAYVMTMADRSHLADDKEFTESFKTRIESGCTFSESALGIYLYCRGKKTFLGVTDDSLINKGRKLIQRSSDNGEPASRVIVAEWLLHGDGVTKNVGEAYREMKAIAEEGYPHAMYKLGLWHYQGIEGISKDEQRGYEFVEKAAFWGDFTARNQIREKNNAWFDQDLKSALSDEDLMEIDKLITHQDRCDYFFYDASWKDEYDKCTRAKDFLSFYKTLPQDKTGNKNVAPFLEWIELLIANLLDLPINKSNIENALKIKADTEKALNLAEQYTCPQHFLHFKDDIKKLELHFDDEVIAWLLNRISILLRPKCQKEVAKYINYLETRGKDIKAKDTKGGVLGGIIIAVIIGIFFWPAGIAFGALVLIGKLMYTNDQVKFQMTSRTSKEDYLLINSLIGYGYSPFEPWMVNEIEYYEGDEYSNNVPSILQKQRNVGENFSGGETDSENTKNGPQIEEAPLSQNQTSPKDNGEYSILVCPSCKRENKNNAKFCGYCGTSLTDILCPQCSKKINKNQKYCPFCGIRTKEI